MADDDKARRVTDEEHDEVEAHGPGGRKSNLANEEAKDETEASSDDDFEAHRRNLHA